MKKKTGGKPGRGQGVLRKDGKPRESNTGTRKPVVDDSNWRVKAKGKHRIKFDDVAKERYLKALAETGQKWFAEQAAGVARSTVVSHLENDPDFTEAYDEAMDAYAAPRIVQIEKDAVEGQEIKRFDPETGEVVQVERRFETPLRAKFLERYAPEYNSKHKVEHSGEIGGVAIVPGVAALSDWARVASEHDRASTKQQNPDEAETEAAEGS